MTPPLTPEVRAMLDALLSGVQAALGPDLVGVYLRGSLALGDFDPVTSDIDFLAVTERAVSEGQFAALAALHARLTALPNPYAHHLEGAYIDRASVRRFGPGERRHPAVGSDWAFGWGELEGDWVLERWIVRERGVTLLGPDPRTLIGPISPGELRAAVRGQLRWWAGLPDRPGWLLRRSEQAFAAQTMCRAHHTLETGELSSKPCAVVWALGALPEEWRPLIERSRAWRNDDTPDLGTLPEVMAFVRWAARAGEVASTPGGELPVETPRPPPDDSWFVRPGGLPERESVGAVVLRRGEAGWHVAVVVEPGGSPQLPKGGLEPGETHEEALHRELREEAGLSRVRLLADLGVQERQNYARTRWQVTRYFLGVTGEVGETPLEPGFRLEWHPLSACPPLFWPEQSRLVRQVRQGLERGEYGPT